MTTTPFSAQASASGYIYQVKLALLLLLEADEEYSLTLETLDDIVFETGGSPIDLIQSKHHCSRAATLTDSSPDLWKSLRIWSEHLHNGLISLPGLRLTLATTASAPDDSIASSLRRGRDSDRSELRSRLVDIANSSDNKALEPCFKSFLSLDEDAQQALVNSIYVADKSPSMDDIDLEVKHRLGLGIRKEHVELVQERLYGWWWGQAMQQLNSGTSIAPIRRFTVAEKIADLNDEYKPDSLPIEFEEAIPPSGIDPTADGRLFIRQLRAIGLKTGRIEKAILDYYRATEQRSKWVREDLLVDTELERYERRLIDEWQRFSDACIENLTAIQLTDEVALQGCGKKIYDHFELEANHRIRERVTAMYIMRGSFHILADLLPPKIHWHPEFVNRLKTLLATAEK